MMQRWLRRSLLALGVLLLLAYLAICAVMYVKQRDLVFYPQPVAEDAWRDVPTSRVETLEFASADPALRLRGWALNPGRPEALVFFGGNAEAVEYRAVFFAECVPNHTVYLLPYRGYGASDGLPSEQALFADALAIEAQIRMRGHTSLDVMGRSLGSGVAVYLASQRPVRRLLLVTPYDSIAAVGQGHYPWLPVELLSTDRFDSERYAPRVRAQVAVMIAGRDSVIPPRHADALVSAFAAPPQVTRYPAAGHGDIARQTGYPQVVCGFLRG